MRTNKTERGKWIKIWDKKIDETTNYNNNNIQIMA